MTSGQGDVFPKGLPVGRVIAIEDKGSALFHFAVLAPVVDFARVEEVLLLTGQTTQDLAGLFPTAGRASMRWLLLCHSGRQRRADQRRPLLSVAGATPDLPLIVTVFWALRRGPEVGCVAGFVAGLLQDVSAGGLVGVQALTKALVGFAIGLAGGRLSVTNPLVQVPGLVLLTVAEGLAALRAAAALPLPGEPARVC